jgi:hypothetical protein
MHLYDCLRCNARIAAAVSHARGCGAQFRPPRSREVRGARARVPPPCQIARPLLRIVLARARKKREMCRRRRSSIPIILSSRLAKCNSAGGQRVRTYIGLSSLPRCQARGGLRSVPRRWSIEPLFSGQTGPRHVPRPLLCLRAHARRLRTSALSRVHTAALWTDRGPFQWALRP